MIRMSSCLLLTLPFASVSTSYADGYEYCHTAPPNTLTGAVDKTETGTYKGTPYQMAHIKTDVRYCQTVHGFNNYSYGTMTDDATLISLTTIDLGKLRAGDRVTVTGHYGAFFQGWGGSHTYFDQFIVERLVTDQSVRQ